MRLQRRHNNVERTSEMTHLYVAVMVELLATLTDVVYVTGFITLTEPLLKTSDLVLSRFCSRLQYDNSIETRP